MKHKFRKRIERLEQIVNPKLYFNSLIIFDPKKPIPPRPPNGVIVKCGVWEHDQAALL